MCSGEMYSVSPKCGNVNNKKINMNFTPAIHDFYDAKSSIHGTICENEKANGFSPARKQMPSC